MRVAVGLGFGVAEGVRARTWVTCASTVEATSVRKGFKSMVGVLVGVDELQADRRSRHKHIPSIAIFFFVRAI